MSNIEKAFVLSTGHMPSNAPNFGPLRTAEHEFGFIVFLCDLAAHGVIDQLPPWLAPVYRLAAAAECDYINFDRDAGALDDLRTWEW